MTQPEGQHIVHHDRFWIICNVIGHHAPEGLRVIDHMPANHSDLAADHGLLNGQLRQSFQYITPHCAWGL